jgi:hypothetical protein
MERVLIGQSQIILSCDGTFKIAGSNYLQAYMFGYKEIINLIINLVSLKIEQRLSGGLAIPNTTVQLFA